MSAILVGAKIATEIKSLSTRDQRPDSAISQLAILIVRVLWYRGGGTSSNLGGYFRIFICVARLAALRAISLALINRSVSGLRYNDKLTIDPTSSSTRSSTFIIQNSCLNCGFKGKYCLLGNIWGS